MIELQRLQTQLEIVARSISCKLDRVGDILHSLACMTEELMKKTPYDEEMIEAWLKEEGFAPDADGFFQSTAHLESFRNQTLSEDTLSYSWPTNLRDNPEARYRLFCHRDMGRALSTLHLRLPGTIWIYYQDVTETALQYPFIDQVTAITSDFKWSEYHTYRSVEPDVNPQREVRWSPPHIDYAGQGLIVAGSIPVYVEDEFVGLWSIDLHVDSLIHPLILTPTREEQLNCVVQRDGMVIASSQGLFSEGMEKGEISLTPFNELHEAFHDLDLEDLYTEPAGYMARTHSHESLIYWVYLPSTDWLCITVIPREALLAAAKDVFRQAFAKLGDGEFDTPLGVEQLPRELLEIGVAYNEMVDKLNQANMQLLENQEELRAQKAKAESANQAKTMFLANISHELRTPLNGITGMHHLLTSTPLNEEQTEYLELAIQSSNRLATLLGDILDLTTIESGTFHLSEKPFDLNESLNTVKALFTPSCQQKGLSLDISMDPSVETHLSGDPVRLQQILNNLIGNSVKFTEEGHILVEVSATSGRSDDEYRVLFSISDTGIGINDQEVEHLFEPFTQEDEGIGRKYQGAGLGLSIVRHLIMIMGGNMSVDSVVGKGTTFHVTLPFGAARADTAPTQAPRVCHEQQAVDQTILLAEDDAINSKTISTLLNKAGFKTETVKNGAEAIRNLSENKYSLVLMDIQMPVMDGVRAIKAIRSGRAGKKNTDIPIIALTAHAAKSDRDHFINTGANDYLPKPVDVDHLILAINLLLTQSNWSRTFK